LVAKLLFPALFVYPCQEAEKKLFIFQIQPIGVCQHQKGKDMWYNSNVSVYNDQELNEVIASRIVKLRKSQQLRQEDVAASLGIKQQSYARYEAGQRRIPVSILPTLAEALNTSMEELLGMPPKRTKRGRISQLEKRFEKINRLPPSEQKFIVEMLDRVLGEHAKVS